MTQLDWLKVSQEWQAQVPPPKAHDIRGHLRKKWWRTWLGVVFDASSLAGVVTLMITLTLSDGAPVLWMAAGGVIAVNAAIIGYSLRERLRVWQTLTEAPSDRVAALRVRAHSTLRAARFCVSLVALQALAVVFYVTVHERSSSGGGSQLARAVGLAFVLVGGVLLYARGRTAAARAGLREADAIEEMLRDPEGESGV